ncbi:MAG TPA: hypothetical protein VEI06_02650 [Gemmatimonadaceae bacterium]|nr:hypothetical protein [Gemmatimonadaceae bacterium]
MAGRMIGAVLALVATLVAIPYAIAPIYDFPEPQAFHGPVLYNPYAGATHGWLRANFHAHARAWLGVTDGLDTRRAIVERYRQLGYAIAGVSDYQYIPPPDSTELAIYEHGYNLRKVHEIAIGASRVEWLDFPLVQGRQQTQYVIDRLRRSTAIIALAHPLMAHLPKDEMRWLTGYDALEVAHQRDTATVWWDVALSTGHPVWAIGDDDLHHLRDSWDLEQSWTMVNAPSADPREVIEALRAGRMYAVTTCGGLPRVHLESLDVSGDTVIVRLDTQADRIDFVGQGGRVLASESGVALATYRLPSDEPYVRVTVADGRRRLFLNPVLRYDGTALRPPEARVDVARTWLLRGFLLVAAAGIFAARAARRASRRLSRPAARPASV